MAAINQPESIIYQARNAYLKSNGAYNREALRALMLAGGAEPYDKTGGENPEISLRWETYEQDLEAFEEVVKLILESVVSLDLSDQEFRITAVPEIISILKDNSPLFEILAEAYSRRPESTLEHVGIVARMVASDGLSSEQVIIARLQAFFHDIGKIFVVDNTHTNSEGKTVRRLSRDTSHHHADLSARMLEELLMGMEDELRLALRIGEDGEGAKRISHGVRLHHGLEAVAVGHLTPAEMAVLIKSVPESAAVSFILALADMGAAGNLNYLSENLNALFKIIAEFSEDDIEKEFGGRPELERILTNSLARIIYEMKHDDWISLNSMDDAMVVEKIGNVMTNLKGLLKNVEDLADDSQSKENLLQIIARAAIEIAGKIEATLKVRIEKAEEEFKPRAEQLILFFQEIFGPLVEKYSSSILSEMQRPA